MEEDNFKWNEDDATEENLTTQATTLLKKKTAKSAIYCGAWISKKSKHCKRRVKAKGDRCVYHPLDIVAIPTVTPTITTTITAAQKTTTRKKPIYCGAWIAERNVKCRSRVKTKYSHCTYHSKDSLPYENLAPNKVGPIIPYKWDVWGLSSRPSYVDRQLRIVLKQAHTSIKEDKPGCLYVYNLKDDESKFYWKIGRTSREAKDRISEWPGAILKFTAKVPFNKLAERIVHLILDQTRILRYVYKPAEQKTSGKLFVSVRKDNRILVVDELVKNIRDENQKTVSFSPIPKSDIEAIRQHRPVRFGNRKKEIEWFDARLSVIFDVIQVVNKSLMEWKNSK